jgi:superfamily I DNA/RNA helicase
LEQDESCPNPLLLESDDEEEKAEWIAKRVLEVKQKYGFVPSIAVFVADKQDAAELEVLLKDDGRLENNGIDVKDCSSGDNLSAQDMLRIFPLDKVKGMEFEVVFFHNIDKVDQNDLIDRYLYVGLSRATFYMAVTSNPIKDEKLEDLSEQFKKEGKWKVRKR